jgi:hypothetical protein
LINGDHALTPTIHKISEETKTQLMLSQLEVRREDALSGLRFKLETDGTLSWPIRVSDKKKENSTTCSVGDLPS